MMRKMLVAALVIIVLSIVAGCGKDGEDGTAYFAISWLFDPLYYGDDNSQTPAVMTNEQFYQTSPGTYNFSYQAWDNSIWSGTYTITVNQGEKGGLFPFDDGADGSPKYFTLYCYSIGPTLIINKAQNAAAEINKASAAKAMAAPAGSSSRMAHLTDGQIDAPRMVLEETQGNVKLTVEFQRLQ